MILSLIPDNISLLTYKGGSRGGFGSKRGGFGSRMSNGTSNDEDGGRI